MNDHFTKPFRRADMVSILEKWATPDGRREASRERMTEPAERHEVLEKIQEYRTFMSEDGIREIASDFGETGGRYIRRMRRAYSERRWPDLGAAAHAMCGLSLNISATRLATACTRIESESDERTLLNAESLFDDMEDELHRVSDLLSRHVL